MRFALRSLPPLLQIAAVALTLSFIASPAAAQRRAASRRAAPTAAPAPAAEASITIGSANYAGSVDANCTLDEKATPTNGRFYYHIMYPWFGAHPAPDQPQWRFSLDLSRPTRPDAFDQFVFSFGDGAKSGTIQKLANAQKMGSGTVRVTRHGAGARFDVAGRSKEGDAIRATIDCAAFPKSEGAGG
jgi:hypothetical protein